MASKSLFLDDDLAQLRQGRYSGEEAELRRELSGRDFSVRLPGLRNALGPSIGTWLGVPAMRSSRPSVNGSRTFHLHHSTVSKNASSRSVAKPGRVYFEVPRGQATAARERSGGQLKWQPSAKSWWSPAGSPATTRLAARYAIAPPPRRAPSPSARPPGRASAHQRYIERESAPVRTDEGVVYSRGTIGDSTEERAAFWNAVEGRERSDGLVQCRIVAELPHELRGEPELQQEVMDKFMESLTERLLPAHGVIHRPDAERRPEGGGDIRNLHAHIVYHDRPCERTAPGAWEFAERKDREARGPAWIRELRERWAGACNSALERVQTPTRFHAGSYADLGIEKIPQMHLGPMHSAFERQGRATMPGTINLLCEREWERRQELAEDVRLSEASATWLRRLAAADKPTGAAGREAWRVLNERVSELDARSAVFDATGAIARRDGDGRRARAESMRAHATRQAARGGGAGRQWARISEAAGDAARPGERAARTDRLRASADRSAAGRAVVAAAARDEILAAGRRPSARRLVAACRASERRLDAARLLDRRTEIVAETGAPGKRSAGAALPELNERDAPKLRRVVGLRGGLAALDERLEKPAGEDGALDAERRPLYEDERRLMVRREARARRELVEVLTRSFGDEAPAVAEALANAAGAPKAAAGPASPPESGAALPELQFDYAAELDRTAAHGQRRELRRRRELRKHLAETVGIDPSRETIKAMVRDAESGQTAVAAARDNEGNLVVFSPHGAPPLDAGATPCFRSLMSARGGIAKLDEALEKLAVLPGELGKEDAEQRAAYERERRLLASREASRQEELVQHLAPLLGRDADGFASALAGAAGEGGGCFVRRGKDGRPAAARGAIDARGAAGCFRLLLNARATAAEAEKQAAMFAGADADAAPRREEARRERLRRELEELDCAIAAQPVALRLAVREGVGASIAATVRRVSRQRSEAARDSGR